MYIYIYTAHNLAHMLVWDLSCLLPARRPKSFFSWALDLPLAHIRRTTKNLPKSARAPNPLFDPGAYPLAHIPLVARLFGKGFLSVASHHMPRPRRNVISMLAHIPWRTSI